MDYPLPFVITAVMFNGQPIREQHLAVVVRFGLNARLPNYDNNEKNLTLLLHRLRFSNHVASGLKYTKFPHILEKQNFRFWSFEILTFEIFIFEFFNYEILSKILLLYFDDETER